MWLPKNLGIEKLLQEKGISQEELNQLYNHKFNLAETTNSNAQIIKNY